MLARKKRFTSTDKSITPLTRSRRGDVESINTEEPSQQSLNTKETPDNLLNTKETPDNLLNTKETPTKFTAASNELKKQDLLLTEGSLPKRRLARKMKRKTKDLSTEKELKRSKRFDRFDSELDE